MPIRPSGDGFFFSGPRRSRPSATERRPTRLSLNVSVYLFGPKLPVEYGSPPRRSFAEAVGRGIVPQNPGRMSLMRDIAAVHPNRTSPPSYRPTP